MQRISMHTADSQSVNLAALVTLLMHTRTNAHLAHLRTTSLSQHLGLEDFYSELVPQLDSFVECLQGASKQLLPFTPENSTFTLWGENPTAELDTLKQQIIATQAVIDYSPLKNTLDEILSTVDQALYRLTFLE